MGKNKDYKTIAGRITRKQDSPNELYNADADTPNKNMYNTESDHNRPQSFTRRPTGGHTRTWTWTIRQKRILVQMRVLEYKRMEPQCK